MVETVELDGSCQLKLYVSSLLQSLPLAFLLFSFLFFSLLTSTFHRPSGVLFQVPPKNISEDIELKEGDVVSFSFESFSSFPIRSTPAAFCDVAT